MYYEILRKLFYLATKITARHQPVCERADVCIHAAASVDGKVRSPLVAG